MLNAEQLVNKIEVISIKLEDVDKKLQKCELDIHNSNLVDVEIKGDIKALQSEFCSLKAQVIDTVSENTKNTWKLVQGFVKAIFVLISVIVLFSGVKLLPEIFTIFGM